MTVRSATPAPLHEGQRAGLRTEFLSLPADEQSRISSALRHGVALDDDAGRAFQYALLARGRTWRRWAPLLGVLLVVGQLDIILTGEHHTWLRALAALAWVGATAMWARTWWAYRRVEHALGLTAQHFA